jgi:hypothetical protein
MQMKVMTQQWNTKLWTVTMSTKLHSTSTESHNLCVHIASHVFISMLITEMSKMPCKKYLSGSERRKKARSSEKLICLLSYLKYVIIIQCNLIEFNLL